MAGQRMGSQNFQGLCHKPLDGRLQPACACNNQTRCKADRLFQLIKFGAQHMPACYFGWALMIDSPTFHSFLSPSRYWPIVRLTAKPLSAFLDNTSQGGCQ